MSFDALSLLIGLALGLALGVVFYLAKRGTLRDQEQNLAQAKSAMEDAFAQLAQSSLRQTQDDFLRLAQEKLKQAQSDGAHDLEKRQKAVSDLITPIQKQLETLGGAVEQIKGTDQALRQDVLALNRETAKLVGALKDPAGQGKWGEFVLEGVLEKSGLMKGVHYDTQVGMQNAEGKSQRPDAVINLHDGLKIVIDSKAPLNEFADRLNADLSEDDYKQIMGDLARQVRSHVKALGKKAYWESVDSPDFTVMFLPAEHLFSLALRADPELVDLAARENVIIASPTLLMSLLRVVHMGWRQAELAKNAQDISAAGADLYQRLSNFVAHFIKIGGNIDRALSSYNQAIGSLERQILPSARKLKDLHVQTAGKDVETPDPLETTQRAITSDELRGDPVENEDQEPKRVKHG